MSEDVTVLGGDFVLLSRIIVKDIVKIEIMSKTNNTICLDFEVFTVL